MNIATIILMSLILLGAIIGFYKRDKLDPPILKFFPYFLLFQFAYQTIASTYSSVFTQHASNYFIFNLSIPINLAYFSLMFHGIIRNPFKRKLVVIGTIINFSFYLINLIFIQGLFVLMTYSRTTMAITLVLYSLLYFHERVTSEEENETNPTRNAAFWIVTAIFFFYLCSTLTIILWNQLIISNIYIGPTMMLIFAFLLYAMYIAGIVLHKPVDFKSPYR